MNVGKSYRLREFLFWTRREVYVLLALGIVPVSLYQLAHWRWLAIPWTVVALIGTVTAFIVSFQNTQTYNRTVEAQQVWTSILNSSKAWALVSRDYLKNADATRQLVNRHLAWVTAMRYQMRRRREWESTQGRTNAEYQAVYCVPETESTLEFELAKYLATAELQQVLRARNTATQLLANQSRAIRELFAGGEMMINFFIEMEKAIKDLLDHQGRSERIKNFPYPRQYAIVSTIFIRFFCVLLPLGLLKEFDALNALVSGSVKGHMVWLVVPFSAMISWTYTSLEQVGASTENPFEGGANDVPIAQVARMIEVEMREMLGDTDLPPLLRPKNNIIL
ncbi:bestrophin family protein [Variovorax guangxiensis]|uniref:Multidrug transporter n=1 Tax=Variovorax guangxiensis TaxID=1775474 RepID=A0A502E0W0_9BURK|nr:bestrophin family ion channel [Variovorax guangxiensis]TPG26325.1 multidrug transporter [Variovorax ginsengisoli]TPG30050.1 multidrug transporter [Variovorax guangxiensis]